MEDKELIDYYEDLLSQLQEIEAKLPGLRKEVDRIQKLFGEIQSSKDSFDKEIQEKRSEFDGTAKIHKDNLSKLATSNIKKITDHAQAKIGDAEQAKAALRETIEQAKEIEKKLSVTDTAILKINAGILSLDERIKRIEKKLAEGDETVTPDYDEVTTPLELYNKYFGKIGRPLVIERVGWNNEFCFKVSGIKEDETALTGRYFKLGKRYKYNNDELPTTYKNCRLYNGPTLEEIISLEED